MGEATPCRLHCHSVRIVRIVIDFGTVHGHSSATDTCAHGRIDAGVSAVRTGDVDGSSGCDDFSSGCDINGLSIDTCIVR